jgi:ribosomal protein L18
MKQNVTEYLIKIGTVIAKRTRNQKDARAVFHRERARHGGKVKFFVIHVRQHTAS